MPDFATRRTLMVDTQVRPSDVTKYPIIDAMLSVPRERYVPAGREEAAYVGENIPLAPNRVLLEPRTFAKMLDALMLAPEHAVLDVGCGLGYSSAVLARMVAAVVAIEEDADLARDAETTLAEAGEDNAAVIHRPLAEGAPEYGPYDAVILQGGVSALPDTFSDQVRDGGRIACLFMEGAVGTVRIGHKFDGALSWRFDFNATAPILPGFEQRAAFLL